MLSNRRIVTAVLVVSILATVIAFITIKRSFSLDSKITTECINEYGVTTTYEKGQPLPLEFSNCVRSRVQNFLEHDYPESKDLAKSFLTLLTAVLVASITFSEKIINFSNASWLAKGLMIICWLTLLGAIVACGIGLALMAQAAGCAAYRPFQNDYRVLEHRAVVLFVTAGVMFGVGLATMLAAGVFSLVNRGPQQCTPTEHLQEPTEPEGGFSLE